MCVDVQGLNTIIIMWEMVTDTNSVKQNPSWEAKISILGQEIFRILKNPIVISVFSEVASYIFSQDVCFKVRGFG